MRSGSTLTQLVEFHEGAPAGDVAWRLLDGRGLTITSGAVTPAAGAVSVVITVGSDDNTLAGGELISPRELQWSFTTGGLTTHGRRRYRLEAYLPLGISEDGVRHKLGVEPSELDDEAIDLVSAYSRFKAAAGSGIDDLTGYEGLAVCDAIEALAAVKLIPSLQVSLSAKESSGTSQYQRADIDWEEIRVELEDYIATGYEIMDPSRDPTTEYGSLLVAVVREDPFTGGA